MQTTQFDHFYPYQEMTDFLLECEREFPAKFRLISLADTAQGRKIWLAEITDFSTMSESQSRSAYYVQAGLHAEEGAGTTAALHWIEMLLTQTAANQMCIRDSPIPFSYDIEYMFLFLCFCFII